MSLNSPGLGQSTPPEGQPPLTTPMEMPPSNDGQGTPPFSPLVYNKLDSEALNEAIEPLMARASACKRNLSDASGASAKAIHDAKLAMGDSDNVDNESQTKLFQATRNEIDAGTDLIKARLDIVEASIKLLVDEFNQGTLDISDSAKGEELMDLEKKGRELRTQLVVRRCQKFQIAGEVVDKLVLGGAEGPMVNEDGWSYIDQLVLRYRDPDYAVLDIFHPRDPDAKYQFRAAVFKAYSDTESTRCVVTGKATRITAARIIPYNIGETIASYLLGPPTHKDGHIICPQNGLPMLKILEKPFDEGKFTIVPGDENDEWKILVLDEAFGKEFEQDYEPLHNKVLTFQTEFRPAKRYFYFAHVIAILRRQRYEWAGWWEDMPPEVWANPGEYIRSSALMVLARGMGHMSPENAAEMLGVEDLVSYNSSGMAGIFSDIVMLSSRGVGGPAAGNVLDDYDSDSGDDMAF